MATVDIQFFYFISVTEKIEKIFVQFRAKHSGLIKKDKTVKNFYVYTDHDTPLGFNPINLCWTQLHTLF